MKWNWKLIVGCVALVLCIFVSLLLAQMMIAEVVRKELRRASEKPLAITPAEQVSAPSNTGLLLRRDSMTYGENSAAIGSNLTVMSANIIVIGSDVTVRYLPDIGDGRPVIIVENKLKGDAK